MTNKVDYLNYVKEVLETVRRTEAVPKASYDTGFGLHIVGEYLGDHPMTLFVMQHSLAKVQPPDIKNFDEWDEAWQEGKSLVRKFIKRYEEAI
jgi:hypothetical protein